MCVCVCVNGEAAPGFGQIELYSHHSAFRTFVDQMTSWGWRLVAVYMLDSQFITDGAKFIAGCMQCQAAMMNLELPHVNVMSKVDLMEDKSVLEPYLNPDHPMLAGELHNQMRQGLRGYRSRPSFHPLSSIAGSRRGVDPRRLDQRSININVNDGFFF